MKKIYFGTILVLITLFAIADIMDENGKAGKTGSPGENDCTGCHTSFAVNSGPGSITISSPNLTNWEYVLGQAYQINVTVAQASIPLFGFGFEALRTSNNTNGGTFAITNTSQTQLKSANVNGSNRTNVVHKQNGGLSTNTHTFSFNWTAPTTNIGNVMFYAAGNATDNQGDSLNDYVYTTSQLVTPFTIGINETFHNGTLKVFPMPAHDFITINCPISSLTYNVQLFDAEGKQKFNCYKETLNIASPITIQLPLGLSEGIYVLKATTSDNSIFCSKVVICQ